MKENKKEREKLLGSRAFQGRNRRRVMLGTRLALCALRLQGSTAEYPPFLCRITHHRLKCSQAVRLKNHQGINSMITAVDTLLSVSKMICTANARPVLSDFPVFQEKLKL